MGYVQTISKPSNRKVGEIMYKPKEFQTVFNIKHWLALSQNGNYEVSSAIYKTKNNIKMYTYYDHKIKQYITEVTK